MEAPTLQTERLFLRKIMMVDWEAYADMWADPCVTEFIGGAPRARDVAWPKFGQAVGMWSLFGYGNWAVIDRLTTTFLGVCGFATYERGIAELAGFPEAGWAFTVESWGRGIASEAIGAIVAWADANDIAETRCLISQGNLASIKVATRNGYSAFGATDDTTIFRRTAP